MDWHVMTIQEIYRFLGTGPHGLASGEAKEKLMLVGRNALEEGKRKTVLGILLAQFRDTMILILLAAAILSGFIGDFADTVAIFIIVVINALLGFVQEYRAEKAIKALKKMSLAHVRVLRGGSSVWLPADELVPGDLLILEAGNAVPADIRITESINLKIEEAALTGESEACEKTNIVLQEADLPLGDLRNMAFKGTFVTYGRGTGVVVATGMQTQLGRIAQMLQEGETLTPLQQRMSSFAKKLSLLVLGVCAIFFLAGWLRGEEVLTLLLTSVSLAVAAIPEALPAVITISLALAARRMVRLNSLVKKLPAVETWARCLTYAPTKPAP